MAARSQPIGLRGCRETMSAAGMEKTNRTPTSSSGEISRGSSPDGFATAAFLVYSSQISAASTSEIPQIPQASQTAPRRRIGSSPPDHCLVVPSDPEVRLEILSKNVATDNQGFVQL